MTLVTGTKLGPYEIVGAIGAGGMGEVYRARDTKLGREVALKVLPEGFAADAERMGRFEREAKVLASLNHPNIAAIHGFEESGGGRALVMELVEGQTLAELVARGPIPLDEALPIAKQIAEGLEYAHERGIVHRDLKPANVKITPEGTVKLLDFGLAKALEGDATTQDPSSSPTMSRLATQAGIILGTAAYMSPEQAKGKVVDRRTDIWAFGCVLYEMLTGKPAFGGETVTDILASVVRAEPDWTALPDHAPPAIQRLARRCLTKDPKQRLQAIGEARIAIDESLSGGTPQTAASPGSPAPIWQRVLPWAAAGILACLGAFGGWWLGTQRAAPATRHRAMHFSAVTNFAGVQAEPAISPDGRSVAFVSNRDGQFNIYVGLVSGGSLIQITHDSNLESRPSWSPDGTTIAYARLNRWGLWDVWEVPALGGTPRRVILSAANPTWSPDGHSLAFTNLSQEGYGGIWISGVSGENAHQAVAPWRVQEGWVIGLDTQPRFSPDGRQLAFVASSADGGPGSMLAVADLDSGKTRFLTRGRAMVRSPAWSPLGRFIYFASSRGGTVNIWKISASGGDPLQVTAGEGDDADVDVSKDGKEIVFGTIRQKVGIARLDLRAKPGQQVPKALTTDPARNQLAPVYSPDGKHLAYFTSLKGVENEEIWVSDADGSNAEALAQDARINIFPAWTPDSKALIYSSLSVRAHGPRGVKYRRVPISGGAPKTLVSIPFWSMVDVGRDGRLLYLGAKRVAEAFDPRTGKDHALGMLPGTVPWKPSLWSPDEHAVAYMVMPSKPDDPKAGLWVDDFKSPPRQIYHGWVIWFARGPGNELYLLQGNADLTAAVWKVNWNGQALTRTHWTVPILYNDNYHHTLTDAFFDVSPDGRYLAFQTDQVLQENIGMIENVR